MLLRRYLQESAHLSRRKIFSLMQSGNVFLNDMVVSDFSVSVKNGDTIRVADHEVLLFVVSLVEVQKKLISFYKPVGYVVSVCDPHNKTIYELLPDEFTHYRYIGRLDKNSRGLLLLSNDLDLVNNLSHPTHASQKTYIVTIDHPISQSDMHSCLSGIVDEGELLSATSISIDSDPTILRIVLQEGKNRHIRRMLGVLGYDVIDLCRVSQGNILLGNLQEGEWRYEEIT